MNPELERNNFLLLRQFLQPQETERLLASFGKLTALDAGRPDTQVPDTPAYYNFKPFLSLQLQSLPKLIEVVGEELYPTYTYARVYQSGDELPAHTDRPACEISFTLHLGGDAEWPIFMRKPNGDTVSSVLSPGDAILYRGTEAEHWRERFGGTWYAQAFVHYVRAYGPYDWAYYDRFLEPCVGAMYAPIE